MRLCPPDWQGRLAILERMCGPSETRTTDKERHRVLWSCVGKGRVTDERG